ncbi:MAG: tetratricopeptide repeat protein [Elusimicrobia bacterium]|nr:tetratricopeptide repeat protein [Elusimicrobiota bacterium]
MKRSLLAIAGIAVLSAGCSLLSPKRPMNVYSRAGAPARTTRVILLPLLDFTGGRPADAKDLELTLRGKWGELYGAKNLVPAAAELAGNGALLELIRTLGNTGAAGPQRQDPQLRALLAPLTAKLGNYNLALAIVSGGKAGFDSGVPVRLHIGCFDTETFAWRWITRTAATKGKVSKWEVDSIGMVSDSFKRIAALEPAAAAAAGDSAAAPGYDQLVAAAAQSAARGSYSAAIGDYQKALELRTDDPEAHMGLADAFMRLDSPLDAEEEYSAAYELISDEDGRGVYLSERIGAALLRQKQYADAKVFFLQAVELAKDRGATGGKDLFNAYHGLAFCLEKDKDLRSAIKNYEKAAQLSDESARTAKILKHIRDLKRKR